MRQTWHVWGFIGCLLLSTATRAGDEPETQPADYMSASAVVRVSFLKDSIKIGPDLIEALLGSTAVLDAAAEGVAGLPVSSDDSVSIGVEQVGPPTVDGDVESLTLRINVGVGDLPATLARNASPARGLLAGLRRELKRCMLDAGSRESQRLNSRVAAGEQAEAEAQQRLKALQSRQQQLLDTAGRADLDRTRIVDEQRDTENQLRDLDFRLVALRARQKAVGEQIARLGKETAAAVETDAVVKELTTVAELRGQALMRVQEQMKANVASQQEVDAQMEQLARARAELAKQRQAAAQAAGGELLTSLNKELLQQSIEFAEASAQQDALQKRLDEMRSRKLLDLADEYEREVQLTLPTARNAVEDAARQHLRAVSDRNRYQPPQVVILDKDE